MLNIMINKIEDAVACENTNQYENLFNETMKYCQKSLVDMLILSEALIRIGKYDDAQMVLIHALDITNAEGRIFFNLGNIEIAKGKYKNSAICYSKAIELGYKTEKCFLNYANAEGHLGNTQQALLLLEETCDMYAETILPFCIFYSIFIRNYNFKDASIVADKSIDKFPENFMAYHMKIITLINEKKYEDAMVVLEKCNPLFSEKSEYIIDYALVLYCMDRAKEALELILKNDEFLDKNSFEYMLVHAKIVAKLHLIDEASSSYKELFDTYAYRNAGINSVLLLILEEKYKDAICILELLIDKKEHDYNFHCALCLYILCSKILNTENIEDEMEKALMIFERDFDDNPNHVYIKYLEAAIHRLDGNIDEEVACLEFVDNFIADFSHDELNI